MDRQNVARAKVLSNSVKQKVWGLGGGWWREEEGESRKMGSADTESETDCG